MKPKERLKILFLAAWYPSEENPVGGIFVKEHAKAVALYNDVTVITFSGSSRSLRRLYEVTENIEGGIRTIRIKHKKSPIPKAIYFIHLWSILSYFQKMLKQGYKPDIIHAHIYSAGVSAVILGRLYKIPVVITEHSSGFPRRLLTVKDKIIARFAMNRAKMILPVSDNLRRAIKDYGIKNSFCVVPNAVNTEMFYPLPNGAKRNDETKRILVVALLTPVKGIPYLLEALHQIKRKRQDFILDIIGDGPNREEYEKIVADLGLRDVVKFHGLKPKEEVAQFMRKCDFFVLPSLWENLPCVLIEAMASGTPVIASDVGGVKEMINKNVGVLIPSKNVEALEKIIENMLDDFLNYSPKRIAKYANDKFSYEAVGKQLDIIYRESLVKQR